MDSDVLLVSGFGLVVFGVPALVSAYSDSRPPVLAAGMLLLGVGMMVAAAVLSPAGYRLDQLPEVFFGVLARILR